MHRFDELSNGDGMRCFSQPIFGSILDDEEGKVTVVVVPLYGTV